MKWCNGETCSLAWRFSFTFNRFRLRNLHARTHTHFHISCPRLWHGMTFKVFTALHFIERTVSMLINFICPCIKVSQYHFKWIGDLVSVVEFYCLFEWPISLPYVECMGSFRYALFFLSSLLFLECLLLFLSIESVGMHAWCLETSFFASRFRSLCRCRPLFSIDVQSLFIFASL